MDFIFQNGISLTFFIAQYPNQAKVAALADTEFCTPPALDNTSVPCHCSSALTQGFVSDHTQPSRASHINCDSLDRCSLPPLGYLQNSFYMGGYLEGGILCESRAGPEDSWAYSSLNLSPDTSEAGDTSFRDLGAQRTDSTSN